MRRAECAANNTFTCVCGDKSIYIQWMRYSAYIHVYLNMDMCAEMFLEFKNCILSATGKNKEIFFICNDGIHKYVYNAQLNIIEKDKKIKTDSIISAVSDKAYVAARINTEKITMNVIWSLQKEFFWVIDSKCDTDQPNEIAEIENTDKNRVTVKYKCAEDGYRIVKYFILMVGKQANEKKKETVYNKKLFMDKRNFLEIKDGKVIHGTISIQRELLKGIQCSILVKTSKGAKISVDGTNYYISQYADRFICTKKPVNLFDTSNTNEEILLECDGNTIIRNGKKYAKIFGQCVFISCTGRYIHQICSDGNIRVFSVSKHHKYLEYVRKINYSMLRNLTSFCAFSTCTSTLFILIYPTSCSVFEYGMEYSCKVVSNYSAKIVSVDKYRKDIILRFTNCIIRYYLDKKEGLKQESIQTDISSLQTLSFSARNINMRQVPVFVHKKHNEYIVTVADKEVAKDQFISHFSLLHKGYIYSDGFSLIFSSGDKVSFHMQIKMVKVLNEPEKSTLLVYLFCGQIHLLHVQNEKVIQKASLHQNINADTVEILNSSSFFSINSHTLTVYERKEYIYPILRVSFPFIIKCILFSDNIYVCTEKNMIYLLICDSAKKTYVARDNSIGLFFS